MRDREGCWFRWHPIETAPKGHDIILSDGKVVSLGGWLTDMDQGAEYEGQIGGAGWWSVDCIERPTHWMPLPEAPSTEREAGIPWCSGPTKRR